MTKQLIMLYSQILLWILQGHLENALIIIQKQIISHFMIFNVK
jgi:hypothetical protein